MTKLTRDNAIRVIQNNLEYLDDLINHAIINLLEDEGIEEGDDDFVLELQYIYDIYVGREKYGKQLT